MTVSFTEAELTNPDMPDEERLSRMMARALGHNDHGGMYWDRYVLAARLVLRECRVEFKPIPGKKKGA